MVKSGIKTLEFWVGALAALAKAIWPEFPDGAVLAIMAWVVGRSAQKYFGVTDADGKPSWLTSEFWTALAFAVAKTVFPDLPEESLLAVVTYIIARTGVKSKAAVKANGGTHVA